MDRRAFLTALTGVLPSAPLAAEAQQVGKVWRIGTLATFPPSPQDGMWKSFEQNLRDHGYVEGRNLHIERRFSEGRAERLPILAAELVQLAFAEIPTNHRLEPDERLAMYLDHRRLREEQSRSSERADRRARVAIAHGSASQFGPLP